MKILDDLLSTMKQEAVVKDMRLGAFQIRRVVKELWVIEQHL